jgi:hypothetical protein
LFIKTTFFWIGLALALYNQVSQTAPDIIAPAITADLKTLIFGNKALVGEQ